MGSLHHTSGEVAMNFSLKNDGIHILGRMNSELINILNNEISIIDHNSNNFNNKDDWRIVELKLTAPTIIGTVNLIKIIEIIKRYYLNFQETSINNHYEKIYCKEKNKNKCN